LRFIRFRPDETVSMEKVSLSQKEQRRLNQRLMLFYTNITRRSETILTEQEASIADRMEVLRGLKELAHQGRALLERGAFDAFGHLLHRGWELKKQMASKISNRALDEVYATARRAGALGGKITGAGGGGFLLLYCPREKQREVRSALRSLPELPFGLEQGGTRVIFDYRR
jgi:D-glycero-alpha-D-manno-heptose-7-phosphate kinase